MRKEQAATPPGAADAPDIDAARKLLEELFSELPGRREPSYSRSSKANAAALLPGLGREAPDQSP